MKAFDLEDVDHCRLVEIASAPSGFVIRSGTTTCCLGGLILHP